MDRFLRSFRIQWHRSCWPIFPVQGNPKTMPRTLIMVICIPGHGNPIKVPRKFASLSLNTKTTTNRVNNAWIWEIEIWKFKNKPNSVFTILDVFWQSKGLESLLGYQGTCLDPQNQLKQAGTRIAISLKDTVFWVCN